MIVEHDNAALKHAVWEHVADDTPRLVYADWLEENGEGDRAEFVRLQCRIAVIRASCSCGACVKLRGGGQHHNGPCAVDQEREELPDGRSRQARLRMREGELLRRHAAAWVGLPGEAVWSVNGERVLWSPAGDALARALSVEFARGWPSRVECSLASLTPEVAKRLAAAGPLEGGVRLVDREPDENTASDEESNWIGPDSWDWAEAVDGFTTSEGHSDYIPASIFRFMWDNANPRWKRDASGWEDGSDVDDDLTNRWIEFPTRDDAQSWMDWAAASWCRSLAGYAPLATPGTTNTERR